MRMRKLWNRKRNDERKQAVLQNVVRPAFFFRHFSNSTKTIREECCAHTSSLSIDAGILKIMGKTKKKNYQFPCMMI